MFKSTQQRKLFPISGFLDSQEMLWTATNDSQTSMYGPMIINKTFKIACQLIAYILLQKKRENDWVLFFYERPFWNCNVEKGTFSEDLCIYLDWLNSRFLLCQKGLVL